MSPTPRFEKPPNRRPWPAAARALVVVCFEEADGRLDTALELLQKRARWPKGLPPVRTLKVWAGQAGITVTTDDPSGSARTDKARAARAARLEEHRADLSDKIATRILPRTIDLIIARLEEQEAVERRVTERRERLDEALVAQRASEGMDSDTVRSARREVVLARLLLEVEAESRIPFRDLVRLTHVGIAEHLGLEGLTDDDGDDDTNPIIVELHLPRPDPKVVEARIIPQAELPERT